MRVYHDHMWIRRHPAMVIIQTEFDVALIGDPTYTNLSLEGGHNKLLVAFYGFLKIFDRKMLVVGMGDENIARTVEVPLVVSIQVWYVGTIVDDNSVKS